MAASSSRQNSTQRSGIRTEDDINRLRTTLDRREIDGRSKSTRRNPSLMDRMLRHADKLGQEVQLDEFIDIDADYDLFQAHKINLLNSRVLYSAGMMPFKTGFYVHNRTLPISCLGG